MKRILGFLLSLTALCAFAGCEMKKSASEAETSAPSTSAALTDASTLSKGASGAKSAVVYFSATGNTRPYALKIAELTAADVFELKASQPYSRADLNYNVVDCRANLEQNDDAARPALEGELPNLESYDVVYLGFPLWWSKPPKLIYTLLEGIELDGKKLALFCTSGSSGIDEAVKIVEKLEPNATILGGKRFGAEREVEGWLDSLQE